MKYGQNAFVQNIKHLWKQNPYTKNKKHLPINLCNVSTACLLLYMWPLMNKKEEKREF